MHTPGPWKANENLFVTGKIGGKARDIAKACQLPCIGGNGDVAAQTAANMEQANARLIAACPTMADYVIKKALEGDADAEKIAYSFGWKPTR